MAIKVYMAGRVSKRPILQQWQDELTARDFEIVSRWSMRNSNHVAPGMKSEKAPESERIRFAIEDLEDIEKCDVMISLMEEPRNDGRGGRHVEFGYALARGKQLVIIGEKETVFHELRHVKHYSTFDDYLQDIDNSWVCDQCGGEFLGSHEGERVDTGSHLIAVCSEDCKDEWIAAR